MNDFWKILLTSTVISGMLSSLISYFVSAWLKDKDYKNEYFKIILHKRLEAYEFLENQIAVLKSIVRNENKNYNLVFSYGIDKFLNFQQNLHLAMSYSYWFNENTLRKMETLNDFFFVISQQVENDQELLEIGKNKNDELSQIRTSLEICVKKDYLELYKIEIFLKSKQMIGKRVIEVPKQ